MQTHNICGNEEHKPAVEIKETKQESTITKQKDKNNQIEKGTLVQYKCQVNKH